jgi:hypothetical protein
MMLAKYSKTNMDQPEALNREMELRSSRRANIDIRNKWLEAKTVKNYQTEYDRIRNHLSHNLIPDTTIEQLTQRKKTLRDLGAQAIDFNR